MAEMKAATTLQVCFFIADILESLCQLGSGLTWRSHCTSSLDVLRCCAYRRAVIPVQYFSSHRSDLVEAATPRAGVGHVVGKRFYEIVLVRDVR